MVITKDETNSPEEKNANQPSLLPSAFMRKLHPEYYSDSSGRTVYKLDQSTFEYHLESLTQRNQTHDFEIFCRKLCERVICPNLRPATGPEGGGDSKADTETFAVADEITELTYVGEPNAGSERWAFAFSAKTDWVQKVRSDVAGLVHTGRNYDRIICVTSRFARAKTRAELEDGLADQHGVPVEIHDRSWIVKEIIEQNRKDLAFNYLDVGREVPDMRRLGPTDYSRSQQLEDIEVSLGNPDAFVGMEAQRVTEALVAAKLSRQLERPRVETEGRFDRAKRLAERYGTPRQYLEACYEAILTAFWWYDDFDLLNSSYDEFEAMLRPDEHVKNVEFLTNLVQLLVNCVIHGHLTIGETKLIERTNSLRQRLEVIAHAEVQPNSALEASTSLLLLKLSMAVISRETDRLPAIWLQFEDILERAKPLSEFNADGLVKLITSAGQVAGNDPGYNALIENTAAFVSERKSAAEGARLLVQRAKQLDADQHFECIRLLGKATPQLSRKEYADELIDALPFLALAYRSAGLFWAARATCLMAAAMIFIQSEEEGELNPRVIWVVELWAWLSLQLRHIPDLLCAMDLLDVVASRLPLTENSSDQLNEKRCEIELALASHLLNYDDEDTRSLETLPDTLDRLHFFTARTALLYSLGYEQQLRDDGSIPKHETPEGAADLFSTLASQPVSKEIRGPLICNSDTGQTFQTTVLGLTITVRASGLPTSILVAEAIIASTEAYLGTALELKIMPHTEAFYIDILESDGVETPDFQMDLDQMRATLEWPTSKIPAQFNFQPVAVRALMEIAESILTSTCHSPDLQILLEQLHKNELVADRIAMVAVTSNSYNRVFGRPFSRLSNHIDSEDETFPLRERPTLQDRNDYIRQVGGDDPNDKSHRNVVVRSVINVHLWDRSNWRGTAFFSYGTQAPPIIALMFENREPAEKIFVQWRERFGARDLDEVIHIAIIKGVSSANPTHYEVLVTSSLPSETESMSNRPTVFMGRHLTVTPDTSANLDRFLDEYKRIGSYLFAPEIFKDGKAEPIINRAILKHRLTIRQYDDIGPNDHETMAFPDKIGLSR